MICSNYDILSHKERIEYIGKVLHSIQSDDRLFIIGQSIIRQAEEWGLLIDVIINPDPIEDEQNN